MSILAALTQDPLNIESPASFQLISKLNKLSQRLSDFADSNAPSSDSPSQNLHQVFSPTSDVIDIAISSSHVAFLLSSNHVCRVRYRVLPVEPRGSFGLLSKSDTLNVKPLKISELKNELQASTQIHATPATFLSRGPPKTHAEIGHRTALDAPFVGSGLIGRGRAIRCPRGSGKMHNLRTLARNPPSNLRRNFLSNPSRTLVPTADIPEELIEQAQAVLQGKSRSLIIRELQRTGIDVNQAVNNLLSKDDDGDEDEAAAPLLGSDELFYLLDSGGRTVQMPMEIDAAEGDFTLDPAIDSIHRFREVPGVELNSGRESRLGFSNPNVSSSQFDISDILFSYPTISVLDPLIPPNTAPSKKTDDSQSDAKPIEPPKETPECDWNQEGPPAAKRSPPLSLSPRVEFYPNPEWWVDGEIDSTTATTSIPPSNALTFSSISSTDADLVAVTPSGHLAYWPWDQLSGVCSSKEHTYPNYSDLELKSSDRIKFLSTSRFRVSIFTSGGAVASWCDRGLRLKMGCSPLDTPLQQLRLQGSQSVVSLSCCDIYSVCLTSGGQVYWWGCMPYSDRKKAISRVKNRYRSDHRKKSSIRGTSRPELLKEGDNVFIRDSPYYPIGTLAVYIQKDTRVGILQENVYSLSERYRFKLYQPSAPDLESGNVSKDHAEKTPLPTEHSYSSSLNHTWHCKDVIFLDEPLFHSSLGEVLKIDGNLAVVRIPSNPTENIKQSSSIDLSSCRLIKKEDVILQRPGNYHRGPVCMHLSPRKLLITSDCSPLSITADTKCLYVLYIQNGIPKLSTTSFENSHFDNSLLFPESMYSYFMQVRPFKLTISNTNLVQSSVYIQDFTGNLLPLIKSQSKTFKEIPYFPLSPVCAFSCYQNLANKFTLSVLSCKNQILTPLLVNPAPKLVSSMMERALKDSQLLASIANESTNAKHNLLHTVISAYNLHRQRETNEVSDPIRNFSQILSSSTENNLIYKQAPQQQDLSSYFDEISSNKLSVASNQRFTESASIISPYSSTAEPSDSDQELHESIPLPSSTSKLSVSTLDSLEILLSTLGTHLPRLLSEKNIDGLTPFMQAIHQRAYDAALLIFSIIIKVSKSPPAGISENLFILSMVFPIDSFPDGNPLFMLCANDPCSVTWTGETHETLIDIYECHTCGLVGDFCCCSECSIVCHRGHECYRKLQPMKAFCDCRKLCCCKGLISGNQNARLQLLSEIINHTRLYTLTNYNGEYILSFLANTHSRQVKEQGHRKHSINVSKSSRFSLPQDTPLFSKKALEICLNSWFTVEAVFAASSTSPSCGLTIQPNYLSNILDFRPNESNAYLDNQKGSTHIDTFVYALLNRNNSDLVIRLLSTLSQAHKDRQNQSEYIISRFIRSVIRIYLISCYDLWGPHPPPNKKRNHYLHEQVQIVFRCMNLLAIKELWSIARAIVTPIQLGIVKPCIPLPSESRKKNLADEFFRTRSGHILIESKKECTQHQDSDNTSSSELSEENHSLLEESESIITPGNNSETTRATIGSSHIVPYFSGDSGSDSEDIHAEDGLDSALEPEDTHDNLSEPPPQNLEKIPAIASESIQVELLSPLTYASNLIPQGEDVPIGVVDNSFSIPPYTAQAHALRSSQQNQLPLTLPEGEDENWHISNNFSNYLWQPSFELISNTNNATSTQSRRMPSYIPHAHENSKPSHSYQEQLLARAFHFLVEQLVNILQHLGDLPEYSLPWDSTAILEMYNSMWCELEPLLFWLIQVMDPLESQLRFGSLLASPYTSFLSIKNSKESIDGKSSTKVSLRVNPSQNNSFSFGSDPSATSPRYDPHPTATTSKSASGTVGIESLDYLISLTRSNSCEHREFIPPINLRSMEHIAHVLDAVLFLLNSQTEYFNNTEKLVQSCNISKPTPSEPIIKMGPENKTSQKVDCCLKALYVPQKEDIQAYFKRSPCLSFFGCPIPNHLAPIEYLPVAEMPHLLQPHTRREVLFGAPQDPVFPDPESSSPFHTLTRLTALLSLPLLKCFSQTNRTASIYSSKDVLVAGNVESSECRNNYDFKRAANVLMGRWRLTIELFCKLLMDNNKNENIKMLKLMEDFPTKESRFRDEMEKISYDLVKEQREILIEISRDRTSLIVDTFKQICAFVEERKGLLTPLCVKQVKVSFKNEQGEGSGVARSFYTCLAEAILSNDTLPSLEGIVAESNNASFQRKEDSEGSRHDKSWDDIQLMPLNMLAAPFHPHYIPSDTLRERVLQGARIYPQVARLIGSLHSDKVTGILLDLPNSQLHHIYNSHSLLTRYVKYAYETVLNDLTSRSAPPTYDELDPSINSSDLIAPSSSSSDKPSKRMSDEIPQAKRMKKSELSELNPLFFEPGKSGFYSPRAGKYTAERKQCYLCVGRIVGLCLLTNEIFPVPFSRHVLKYLIGKGDDICWHDYAFMDPVGFESLRSLLLLANEGNAEAIRSMELTFEISLSPFESAELIDLLENGISTLVNIENTEHYVKLYTEYRMKKVVREALIDMQLGLSEVIPLTHFSNITPEDFRLLLNGCNSFNLDSFKKIVGVSNESREDDKLVSKFMKWFWLIVFGFSEKEKQDLLYFWTSSPNIPASIHSYQPEPSIHIRPPDDEHLPTANTCIARLYIPLYSHKILLKTKLLLAIKTKIFGFV